MKISFRNDLFCSMDWIMTVTVIFIVPVSITVTEELFDNIHKNLNNNIYTWRWLNRQALRSYKLQERNRSLQTTQAFINRRRRLYNKSYNLLTTSSHCGLVGENTNKSGKVFNKPYRTYMDLQLTWKKVKHSQLFSPNKYIIILLGRL